MRSVGSARVFIRNSFATFQGSRHKFRADSWGARIKNSFILFAFIYFLISSSFSNIALAKPITLKAQETSAWSHLLANLNHPDIIPGTVIASPSKDSPNYFFHWVRDAGLVVYELLRTYRSTNDHRQKEELRNFMELWIQKEIQHQKTAERSEFNLGEPIFTVQGELYPFPWGRPQSDGPAIRAITMIQWARIQTAENRPEKVTELYRAEIPAKTPIKRDLEYVAHHWRESTFDLWEEVKGLHFFTLMAQRAALILGAQLASDHKDWGASSFYYKQALEIESVLKTFYDSNRGYIVATQHQTDGWRHKESNLDTSVILASIYFSLDDGFMTPQSPQVTATALKLIEVFSSIYRINNTLSTPLIGRYPEDVYDGNGMTEGNPWFLTTFAIAEWACTAHFPKMRDPSKQQIRGLDFLETALNFVLPGGHMSEQIDRKAGNQRGARDLTWSYASYLRAYQACKNTP